MQCKTCGREQATPDQQTDMRIGVIGPGTVRDLVCYCEGAPVCLQVALAALKVKYEQLSDAYVPLAEALSLATPLGDERAPVTDLLRRILGHRAEAASLFALMEIGFVPARDDVAGWIWQDVRQGSGERRQHPRKGYSWPSAQAALEDARKRLFDRMEGFRAQHGKYIVAELALIENGELAARARRVRED